MFDFSLKFNAVDRVSSHVRRMNGQIDRLPFFTSLKASSYFRAASSGIPTLASIAIEAGINEPANCLPLALILPKVVRIRAFSSLSRCLARAVLRVIEARKLERVNREPRRVLARSAVERAVLALKSCQQ
jgi:hypothetical protein